MMLSTLPVFSFLLASGIALAQDTGDGYFGYEFERRGDEESAGYETANTDDAIGNLSPIPDVYLNASVHVGEINIEVDNITAKVNLDAKVLNLLHFTAGVSASVDRVRLNIQNVTAKVELEARLENVVAMIGDVLDVIDANPIIATLGQGLGDIVGNLTDDLGNGGGSGSGSDSGESEGEEGGESSAARVKRSAALQFKLDHNILYSVNDYSGNVHRNRVLAQNGSLIDAFLDNHGHVSREKVVGFYSRDMTFNGHNRTITEEADPSSEDDDDEKETKGKDSKGKDSKGKDSKGKEERAKPAVKEFELQYIYTPFPGLEAVSNIYVNTDGEVVRTQVIAEAEGGGTSTIANEDEL